jgi:hypothetical protein
MTSYRLLFSQMILLISLSVVQGASAECGVSAEVKNSPAFDAFRSAPELTLAAGESRIISSGTFQCMTLGEGSRVTLLGDSGSIRLEVWSLALSNNAIIEFLPNHPNALAYVRVVDAKAALGRLNIQGSGRAGANGVTGKKGADGRDESGILWNRKAAKPGADGHAGQDGAPGENAVDVTLSLHNAPANFLVTISANGGRGGDGGHGGRGGDGGSGKYVGRGKDGGDGGSGGNGGRGGDGGIINAFVVYKDGVSEDQVQKAQQFVNENIIANPGDGGAGGDAGPFGDGGDKGTSAPIRSGSASRGSRGSAGHPGAPGSSFSASKSIIDYSNWVKLVKKEQDGLPDM